MALMLTLSVNAQGFGQGFGRPAFGQSFGQGQGQGQDQGQQRFSPERFQQQLEEFITKEANLTAQEAATFFPIYKEMAEKQRAVFMRQRNVARVKPADEQGCLKAIKEQDEIDLELKRIQQTYHLRFLEVLSASKVYDILRAEEKFHRNMMRSWGRRPRPQMPQSQQGVPQR